MPAILDLERQVNDISTRLGTAEGRFSVLESIESNLSQMFKSIESSRHAAIDAAEKAAFNAVQGAMSRTPGSEDIATSDALTTLERSLFEVKNQAAAADKQNQETLQAIHDTLKRVIERVNNLELDAPMAAKSASNLDLASRSLADTPDDLPGDNFDEFRLPPLPEFSPAEDSQSSEETDEPAEREKLADEEPAPGEESTEFSRAYDAPEPSLSHNEDFIAAARQAARAASEVEDGLDPTALPAPGDCETGSGIINRFRGRKRSLYVCRSRPFYHRGHTVAERRYPPAIQCFQHQVGQYRHHTAASRRDC